MLVINVKLLSLLFGVVVCSRTRCERHIAIGADNNWASAAVAMPSLAGLYVTPAAVSLG
jgi:hypothetical protein